MVFYKTYIFALIYAVSGCVPQSLGPNIIIGDIEPLKIKLFYSDDSQTEYYMSNCGIHRVGGQEELPVVRVKIYDHNILFYSIDEVELKKMHEIEVVDKNAVLWILKDGHINKMKKKDGVFFFEKYYFDPEGNNDHIIGC